MTALSRGRIAAKIRTQSQSATDTARRVALYSKVSKHRQCHDTSDGQLGTN